MPGQRLTDRTWRSPVLIGKPVRSLMAQKWRTSRTPTLPAPMRGRDVVAVLPAMEDAGTLRVPSNRQGVVRRTRCDRLAGGVRLSAPTVRFWLDVRVNGGAVVIGVHGELDADTAAQLSACAAAAVESSNDDVCFDLGQVTFVDCAGTRVLVSTRQSLAALGRTLYLDDPSDCVRRLLELSGLDQFFALRLPLDAAGPVARHRLRRQTRPLAPPARSTGGLDATPLEPAGLVSRPAGRADRLAPPSPTRAT